MDLKLAVPEDMYFKCKKKYDDKEEMMGLKVVPVNMHSRPVSIGKKDSNAFDKIEALNHQMNF